MQLEFRDPPAKATGASGRPGLRSLIAAWDERAYFRWQLARMATDTPELVDDIGLTMAEVEAEIAKPFWRR
ncbi:DUF1127 domain-containing protein [Mesorhizobium sp. AR02]|nr:DUF1127 domain-containing protein [Mesorhizobium sp. AR02]